MLLPWLGVNDPRLCKLRWWRDQYSLIDLMAFSRRASNKSDLLGPSSRHLLAFREDNLATVCASGADFDQSITGCRLTSRRTSERKS